MKSINEVLLFGNVGKDPEVRTLDNKSKVASFSLATSTGGYKKQDGTEVPERTQWHNISCWRSLADIAEKYIHKGDKIIVKGMITYDEVGEGNNKKRYTEIVATDISLTGVSHSDQQSDTVNKQNNNKYNRYSKQEFQDNLPF